MYHPEADINLNNIKENLDTIQSMIDNGKIMAVIKANAYGHGFIPIANTLSQLNVHGFCVALAKEAKDLIDSGIKTPILHLGRIHASDLDLYDSGQVRCTINSIDDISLLKKKFSNKSPINVHVKIDTGMGRMGLSYNNAEKIFKLIKDIHYIKVEAVYSHFSTSDEIDTKYRDYQLQRFIEVVECSKSFLSNIKYFHIANSSAILTCKKSHFNMVRPGISLYGVSPLGKPHKKLKPVMKMKSYVVLLKRIKSGESVGYNRLYISNENEKIALVQAGDADGIPLALSNSGSVEIHGENCPIIGKVSMDLIAVKCVNNNIAIGDQAIFWGGSKNTSLECVAKKSKCIPYQFLTGVSSRVSRNYIYE